MIPQCWPLSLVQYVAGSMRGNNKQAEKEDAINLGTSCSIIIFKRFRELPKVVRINKVRLKDYQEQEGLLNMGSFASIEEVEKFLRGKGSYGIRMLEYGDVVTLFYGDKQEEALSLLYTTARRIQELRRESEGNITVIRSSTTGHCFVKLDTLMISETERLIRGL